MGNGAYRGRIFRILMGILALATITAAYTGVVAAQTTTEEPVGQVIDITQAKPDSVEKIKKLPDPLNDHSKIGKANLEERNKQKKTSSDGLITTAATSGTYDPATAINYVRTYAQNPNPAYRRYDKGDCTNFMSQALNWAGWQHIGGWYSNPNYWWYDPASPWEISWGNKGESWSWINAHYLHLFMLYSKRGFSATSWSQFLPGDIIQIDFANPQPDGTIDHSMMITKIENGEIFVTQQSPPYVDRKFKEVIDNNPGANYYGMLFYYQY